MISAKDSFIIVRGFIRRADNHCQTIPIDISCSINLVCFRLRVDGPRGDTLNKSLLDRINASGAAYLTHTVLPTGAGPRVVLRMAIGGVLTREVHVRGTWDLIVRLAGESA